MHLVARQAEKRIFFAGGRGDCRSTFGNPRGGTPPPRQGGHSYRERGGQNFRNPQLRNLVKPPETAFLGILRPPKGGGRYFFNRLPAPGVLRPILRCPTAGKHV